MNTIKVETLKPEQSFKEELLLDKSFILLGAGQPVTSEFLKELAMWNVTEVLLDGSNPFVAPVQQEKVSEEDFESVNIDGQPVQEAPKMNTSIKEALAKAQDTSNEKSRLNAVLNVYNEYMTYIHSVYTRYATHGDFNKDELFETVKELCVFVKENRRYVLRISPSIETRTKNYLVSHAMRSTIFAIVIGLKLHLNFTQLQELGVSCILHEIGMLKLPSYLYLSEKKFSHAERAKIATHPLLGYQIINQADFPISVQRAILEHHEKEDGSGYPQNLVSEKISNYAKIISVVCSYEAMSSPRNFREARSTYDAMVEMLKNQNSKYNGDVIKALLYSLSIYPIGAYVYLANGKIGQVCDVNSDNPKNPIVQILGEKAADGDPRTIETDDGINKIVRVLNSEEARDAIKFLKQKETE
ncbi:MAG: HD domain-containing protein [Treponema sp.]|uniref:HD-GYP domain-containing protein n=1 Tax=Treponema sp. TaxID=166 RepID=UPI00298E0F1A|nr:HD domain-containing phosphohydrolase [Treponema sp.]MCR5387296.1 HD domain-containing protein [Treponema sp.]